MSRLEQALAEGRFVVTAEMPTIDGGGMDEVRFQLEPMAPYLDACNATDNTAAHAHASPLAIAIALQQCGMEPIMQLVCRDRNRLALEADIVGAALHGIENICCLTGDDVTAGDEPEARRVFDLDSPQLLATARGDRGRPLPQWPHNRAPATSLPRRGRESRRAAVRLPRRPGAEEGARGRALPAAADQLRAAPARGVRRRGRAGRGHGARRAPAVDHDLRSARALRFIDEKVPGISVPADMIERVEAASDQQEACFDVAYELAQHARSQPGVRGLHFISFRKDAGIAALCRRLGIPTHAERVEHGYRSPVPV